MNLWEKVESLEREAVEFGLQWETTAQILDQIRSECREISEHLPSREIENPAALQEEIGDLLHAVFSLCIYCHFSPKDTFKQALEKFARRLQAVKLIAQEKQLDNLQGKPFSDLMAIWDLAKERVS